MTQYQPLEPRDVLPYTDAEIREIYVEAQAIQPEAKAMAEAARSWVALLEGGGLCIAVYALVGVAVGLLFGVYAALWVSAVAFAGMAFYASLTFGVTLLGPLAKARYRSALRKARQEQAEINPYDVAVLRVVVDHVASGPMHLAQEIVDSVEANRRQIEASLDELPVIAEALGKELESSHDEGMKTLLAARHDAAQEACRRLRSLDEELVRQGTEAVAAVTPIRELREKFERVEKLSSDLARIQAAHGLIDKAEQSVEDHRLQLRLLRASVMAASVRLQEIRSLVDANEQARAELSRL